MYHIVEWEVEEDFYHHYLVGTFLSGQFTGLDDVVSHSRLVLMDGMGRVPLQHSPQVQTAAVKHLTANIWPHFLTLRPNVVLMLKRR